MVFKDDNRRSNRFNGTKYTLVVTEAFDYPYFGEHEKDDATYRVFPQEAKILSNGTYCKIKLKGVAIRKNKPIGFTESFEYVDFAENFDDWLKEGTILGYPVIFIKK